MITADQGVRGGKIIELKKTVVTAVAKCPSVSAILVSKRTGNTVVASALDVDLDEVSWYILKPYLAFTIQCVAFILGDDKRKWRV